MTTCWILEDTVLNVTDKILVLVKHNFQWERQTVNKLRSNMHSMSNGKKKKKIETNRKNREVWNGHLLLF